MACDCRVRLGSEVPSEFRRDFVEALRQTPAFGATITRLETRVRHDESLNHFAAFTRIA
jgi:hypothetical protein